jgi:outer membrane lipoprotein SlyB
MRITRTSLALAVALVAGPALADDTLDAALGGGLGGATGAVLGNEVGGRSGAILGGAVGAAAGTAITVDGDRHYDDRHDHDGREVYYVPDRRGQGYFCPPGQAKKGRC